MSANVATEAEDQGQARRVYLLRYETRPEHARRNEQLVRAVFDEIHQAQPAGISYSTFLLEDGVTFVNLVVTETEDGLAPLGELESYRRLQEGKHERFAAPPEVSELHELGSYGLLPG